jgi:hypothetical protein
LIISEPKDSKREQIISDTFDLLWQMISAWVSYLKFPTLTFIFKSSDLTSFCMAKIWSSV